MICPECGTEISSHEVMCPKCEHAMTLAPGSTLGDALDQPHTAASEPSTRVSQADEDADPVTSIASADMPVSAPGPLKIGETFGGRYHIRKLLGAGGMGAVYEAHDQEVGVHVALKVIRPEAAADPRIAEELDRRFKRELVLARQVTHRNVVRIHDLGDVDGIKYITMTFIEGHTLAAKLARGGTMSVEEALEIMRPMVSGLVAAHEAGVVHRDLKPANIMIETESGEPYVMDFGIARSATEATDGRQTASSDPGQPVLGGDTAVGAVIGTLQYMAPEQFLGQEVDQRADVYALGLIFYDLIVGGRLSRGADSAMAEFRARMEKAPSSPRSRDLSIPEAVDRIISRCLAPEPDARYQSTAELEAVLDRLDETGQPKAESRRLTGRMMAAVATMVVALLIGTWWIASRGKAVTEQAPMSVLIADFVNETGDNSFDGALEQALTIAMEGAGFISAFPRPNALRIADQLQEDARLDETMARLISRREGIGVILSGRISGDASGYELEADALDPGFEPGEGRPLASARNRASDREDVLAAVTRLASELRGELGDTTPRSVRLAAAETYTAASLEAMSAYARGQELSAQGLFNDAVAAYQEALEHDPDFGRAYAGLGVVYGNLHQEGEAEASYQQALQRLDRMSERERYRTLGGYYLLVSGNYDKAIENYSTLVELFPADGVGHSNLAYAYHKVRRFDQAVEAARRSVELEPSNLIKRINYAMFAMYAGDFDTAIAESETVLEQNPDFGYAEFTLGRSAQATGDFEAAREAFARLGSSAGYGSWLAPLGEADLAMYLGRSKDAAVMLESVISELQEGGEDFTTASALVGLAEARLILGESDGAAQSARQAMALSESEAVLYPAARVLLAAGRAEEAAAIAGQLDNMLQSQTAAAAGLIRGELALAEGQLGDALRELRTSREQVELWFSRYLMGRAYFDAGHYPEAFDELDACVRRSGEVTDIFLVDGATLRYFPPALYWLARTSEALGQTNAAAELYERYADLRGGADPADPLMEDTLARLQAAGS